MTPKQAYELATLFSLHRVTINATIGRVERELKSTGPARAARDTVESHLRKEGERKSLTDQLNQLAVLESDVKRILNLG